jgi:hypothetical protein
MFYVNMDMLIFSCFAFYCMFTERNLGPLLCFFCICNIHTDYSELILYWIGTVLFTLLVVRTSPTLHCNIHADVFWAYSNGIRDIRTDLFRVYFLSLIIFTLMYSEHLVSRLLYSSHWCIHSVLFDSIIHTDVSIRIMSFITLLIFVLMLLM